MGLYLLFFVLALVGPLTEALAAGTSFPSAFFALGARSALPAILLGSGIAHFSIARHGRLRVISFALLLAVSAGLLFLLMTFADDDGPVAEGESTARPAILTTASGAVYLPASTPDDPLPSESVRYLARDAGRIVAFSSESITRARSGVSYVGAPGGEGQSEIVVEVTIDALIPNAAGLARALGATYAGLLSHKEEPVWLRLSVAVALGLFLTSLWTVARMTRWPLLNISLMVVVIRVILWFFGIVREYEFQQIVSGFVDDRVLVWIPPAAAVLIGTLFLLVGAAMGPYDAWYRDVYGGAR